MTLVDVKINPRRIDPRLALMGFGGMPERKNKGIYLTNNFHNTLRDNGYHFKEYGVFDEEVQDLLCESKHSYGVADDIEQVLEFYKAELAIEDRNFVVTYEWVHKVEQPEDGGWRWHKWGPYIGQWNITQEYIYNEPKINSVICYHIYEILSGEVS